MTKEDLFLMIGETDPMLVALAEKSQVKSKKAIIFRPAVISAVGAIAACLLIAVGVTRYQKLQIYTNNPINVALAEEYIPLEFNYSDKRYVVIEAINEEDFKDKEKLGTKLGVLVDSKGKELSDKNLETNELAGGIVYELPGYSPDYRLVVKYKKQYHIAQVDSKADGSSIDIKDFYAYSKIKENAYKAQIFEDEVVELNEEETQELLNIIEQSKITVPTMQEKEAANITPSSWTYRSIYVDMKDGTFISMIIFPERRLLIIGNNFYKLPDSFFEKYKNI